MQCIMNFEEIIEIETLSRYSGKLPTRQRGIVIDWMKENKENLLNYWEKFSS